MTNFLGNRNVFIAAAAAAFLTVAGCSNQPEQAQKQPTPARKAAPAKPAAAAKAAPAKPAATASAKTASAKPTAKPVKASSKTPAAKPASASSKVAPATNLVTVPKGTALSATLGTTLASNKNKAGDSFTATLRSSVKVDGKTVIPKGAKLTGHVITAKKKAPAELTVALSSVEIQGKAYPLHTEAVAQPAPQAKDSGDNSDASKSQKKDITLAAQSHLKFKLAKSAKLPVKS